jgi:hypothetical protein
MLQQEGGGYRGIPRVHVHGGAVLTGVQEDFSKIAVLEPSDPGRVVYSAMLETEQFVTAPIRQSMAGLGLRRH